MEFHEKLTDYMEEYNITVHQLAKICHVSDAVISRYKSGTRLPRPDSGVVREISEAIASKSSEGRDSSTPPHQILTSDEVYESLILLIPNANIDTGGFTARANRLVNTLEINISAFAKAASYDPSFISRVLKGQRNPSDYSAFAENLASYASSWFVSHGSALKLPGEVVCDIGRSDDTGYMYEVFMKYLLPQTLGSAEHTHKDSSANTFLEKIDSFDLDRYIKAVHFDKLMVPTVPFKRSRTKHCFGEKGMKKVEIDFLISTALSPDCDPVYMYSTMPMETLVRDIKFSKKWMVGLASVLKKGHDIHTIHDINRPESEMMAGIENWIPLYMTGQIHPYYLPGSGDVSMKILMRSSGACTLWGTCLNGDLENSDFYMTYVDAEAEVYKKRIDAVFKKAQPLMDIYRSTGEFEEFLQREISGYTKGECKRKMSVPPYHTLSDDLLIKLCRNANIPDRELDLALLHLAKQKMIFEEYCRSGGTLKDSFPLLGREEVESGTVYVAASGAFLSNGIPYTYDTYLEHVRVTNTLSKQTKNYQVKTDQSFPFRNIQITLMDNKWALVSKNTAPTIHFVMRHPVLVNAIDHFSPPITE